MHHWHGAVRDFNHKLLSGLGLHHLNVPIVSVGLNYFRGHRPARAQRVRSVALMKIVSTMSLYVFLQAHDWNKKKSKLFKTSLYPFGFPFLVHFEQRSPKANVCLSPLDTKMDIVFPPVLQCGTMAHGRVLCFQINQRELGNTDAKFKVKHLRTVCTPALPCPIDRVCILRVPFLWICFTGHLKEIKTIFFVWAGASGADRLVFWQMLIYMHDLAERQVGPFWVFDQPVSGP